MYLEVMLMKYTHDIATDQRYVNRESYQEEWVAALHDKVRTHFQQGCAGWIR